MSMNIRQMEQRDRAPVIGVIDDWWGGRHRADMLPKLFFAHFRETSFAVEEQGNVIAFWRVSTPRLTHAYSRRGQGANNAATVLR